MTEPVAEAPGTFPAIVPGAEASLTAEQAEQFAAQWLRRSWDIGKITLPTQLPRRVRLRLWCARRVDLAAIWLVERDRHEAAIRLWRIFGMWKG